MTSSDYDIYIVEHVEELKRDYDELWERYKGVLHENAMLHAELDRFERRVREVDRECEWMNL